MRRRRLLAARARERGHDQHPADHPSSIARTGVVSGCASLHGHPGSGYAIAMLARLAVVAVLATACSSPERPVAPAPAPAPKPAPPVTRRDPITPVVLSPGVLPGWTNRSAHDGWWSANGAEQIFVSDVDLGPKHDVRSPGERAVMVAQAFAIAQQRQGGDARAARPDELPAGAAACTVAFAARDSAHNLSCAYARDGGRPALGVEYTLYGELAEADFLLRARLLIANVAKAAL